MCNVAEWDKFDGIKWKKPEEKECVNNEVNRPERLNNTENKLTNMLSWLLTKKGLEVHECLKMILQWSMVMTWGLR